MQAAFFWEFIFPGLHFILSKLNHISLFSFFFLSLSVRMPELIPSKNKNLHMMECENT